MDTATFFEKFSLFAQAEGAAARFREVVLNLAFSGKLKGTDPSGWETHPIGDFFTEGLKSINAPESPNQTYELWSVPSFETGAPEIVTGAQVGSTKRELRDGTILLGKINPHLNRIWVVNRRTNYPMIASQEWINVTAGDKWDTGYLARLLSSPSFNRSVCATAQGMGSLTRANTKQVAQIVVHCPPLKEQQKLIAKVDELMALCDRLEAQLKERDVKQAALAKAALAKFTEDPTPENLQLLFHPSFTIEPEDLRKSILTLAIHGKLVSQNANDEPAADLPARVTLSPIGVDEIPFEIPNSWRWKKLGAIALIERGGSPRPIKDYITNDAKGLNWIKIGDTEKGGKFITSTEEKIRPEGLSKTRRVCPGDFLLTNSMSFGRPYITKIAGCIHDGWLRINPPKQIEQDYLYHLLSSPYAYSFFRSAAAGAVVQNLNADKVRELPIPIPPIGEQARIKKEVEKLLALVDTLEAQLEASRTTGEKLLEAMVTELTAA